MILNLGKCCFPSKPYKNSGLKTALCNTCWKKSALPQTYLDVIFISTSAVSAPTIKNVFLIKLHNTHRIYHHEFICSCTELWICSLYFLTQKWTGLPTPLNRRHISVSILLLCINIFLCFQNKPKSTAKPKSVPVHKKKKKRGIHWSWITYKLQKGKKKKT